MTVRVRTAFDSAPQMVRSGQTTMGTWGRPLIMPFRWLVTHHA